MEQDKTKKDMSSYMHGERSLEGIQKYRETMQRIKMLTKLAKQLVRIK